METPEKIKNGLEHCIETSMRCHMCDYVVRCLKVVRGKPIMQDALALIQQLEADNASKDERIQMLEREQEAMLEEMRMAHNCCSFCKHNLLADGCAVTPDPAKRTCFEWRGVCPENTEVQEDD